MEENEVKAIEESEYGSYQKQGFVISDRGVLKSYIGREAKVVIPSVVTAIGEKAFKGCSGLTSVTIPSGVTSIGLYAFSGCSALADIYFDGTEVEWKAISKGEYWEPNSAAYKLHFYESQGLAFSLLSNGTYEVTGIGTCTDTKLVIPSKYKGKAVTSIGDRAFYDCRGLTSVTIPSSVTSIGEYAFRGCTGLTSVTIPDSVTWIGEYAFMSCSGLTSVTIPDSVKSSGNYAFYYCTGLTSVTIRSGVTRIGSFAFIGCRGLTSVTIPNSVTSIGEMAFFFCSGLTSVTYQGTKAQWNAISKDSSNWNYGTGAYTVHCTDGDIKK